MVDIDETISDNEMDPARFDYVYKIVVIGSSGVGKTSFLRRYFDKKFEGVVNATVGVDFRHRNFKRNGKRMQLQIWDTAGQERYQSLTTSYFRGSMAIMIMFDLTTKDSFEACKYWIEKATGTTGPEEITMILIGNKVDCDENERQVTTEEAEELAKGLNMRYFESSAKENINVTEVIEYLLYAIPDKAAETHRDVVSCIQNEPTPEENQCLC